MTYSLWRGERLLGRLVPELPNAPANMVAAILQPADGFAPTRPLVQQRMKMFPGAPIFEHEVEPPDPSGAASRTSMQGVPSVDGEVPGLSPEEQLQIRDADGNKLKTDRIAVMEMRLSDQREMDALCAEAGVTFSGWLLMANLSST